jgi:hypothetical protein
MRIRFTFKARFIDTTSGSELEAVSFLQDVKLSEDILDSYLDTEIADEGVVGGELYLKRTATGQPAIEVTYWHPSTPGNRIVDSLQAYTDAQLDDGIGEGGFEFDFDGRRLLVIADTDETGISDMNDDGRAVSGPPRIAIAARDGDLLRLAAELKAAPKTVDRLHQGCTALHLAILFGHPEAVPLLLAAGANPDVVDSQGLTPLEACALINGLDDEQSRDIGRVLLEAGGNPMHHAPDGESAKTYAESRQKKLLAAIL